MKDKKPATDEPFVCDKCGACCRLVFFAIDQAAKDHNSKEEITQLVREFPYEIREDGSCSMLGDDGLCTVYSQRPLICNVDEIYKRFYADKMSKKVFNKVTHKSCDMIRQVIIKA